MRIILIVLILLTSNVKADLFKWLFSPNTILCTVIGPGTMNGDPFSIEQQTCTKLPEFKDSANGMPLNRRGPFCEFDYETGKFTTNYSEIPAAVIARYNNRKYTGWSGNVKSLEDKVNMGIDILSEIKRCNIEASQFVNEYLKKKSVEGFNGMEFLYDGKGIFLRDFKEIVNFINSSLELYDCDYNCEVHKERKKTMTSKELLNEIFNYLSVKGSNSFYFACAAVATKA